MDKVVHFEVPYDDLERAKKFYIDVFGWKIQSMPEMNYNIGILQWLMNSKCPRIREQLMEECIKEMV